MSILRKFLSLGGSKGRRWLGYNELLGTAFACRQCRPIVMVSVVGWLFQEILVNCHFFRSGDAKSGLRNKPEGCV